MHESAVSYVSSLSAKCSIECQCVINFNIFIAVLFQITKIPMSYTAESVCLEVDTDLNTQLYVVGSRSHVTFIDARVPHWPAGFLKSPDDECGVRSLKFNQDVLSFGTGAGNLFFYDLRAGALLSSQSSREQPFKLQTSPGYVVKKSSSLMFTVLHAACVVKVVVDVLGYKFKATYSTSIARLINTFMH